MALSMVGAAHLISSLLPFYPRLCPQFDLITEKPQTHGGICPFSSFLFYLEILPKVVVFFYSKDMFTHLYFFFQDPTQDHRPVHHVGCMMGNQDKQNNMADMLDCMSLL